jgi:hypothetical protein
MLLSPMRMPTDERLPLPAISRRALRHFGKLLREASPNEIVALYLYNSP